MLSVEFPVVLDCFRSKASFHKQMESQTFPGTFQCPVNLYAVYDTANFCKSVLVSEGSVLPETEKRKTVSGQKLKTFVRYNFSWR